MRGSIETITGLLLGAAYADKRLEGKEIDQIRTLLLRLLGEEELPSHVADQISGFNPARFNPAEAASALIELPDQDRRKILEMVAAVHEADDEIDLDEDKYLITVAKGLGVSAAGLTISFEELSGSLGDESKNLDEQGDGNANVSDGEMGGGFGDGGDGGGEGGG